MGASGDNASDVILLRTARLDPRVLAFGRELEAASGSHVAMLVDERKGGLGDCGFPKVSLTREACRRLRVYAPQDFTWRCGDYGFYVARSQFPEASAFWMIEYDVRILGDAGVFFARCAAERDIDFLGVDIRPSRIDWWWYPGVRSRDVTPYHCLFPLVRLSPRAVDALLAGRRRQSRQPLRRILWPNDESFVSTEIVQSGLTFRDINDVVPNAYDARIMSFWDVYDGDTLTERPDSPRLYHSVLYGTDLAEKRARIAAKKGRQQTRTELATRRVTSKLLSMSRW